MVGKRKKKRVETIEVFLDGVRVVLSYNRKKKCIDARASRAREHIPVLDSDVYESMVTKSQAIGIDAFGFRVLIAFPGREDMLRICARVVRKERIEVCDMGAVSRKPNKAIISRDVLELEYEVKCHARTAIRRMYEAGMIPNTRIADILLLTREELIKQAPLGPKSMAAFERFLAHHGLTLGMKRSRINALLRATS